MKIVLVCGEPATGKTTLAQAVMKGLGLGGPFKSGLVCGTVHRRPYPGGTAVIGIYGQGQGFWGTDRLSMAVLPSLKHWLDQCEENACVFMEGDRVTSKSFIDHLCAKFDLTLIVLTASAGTLERRQKMRGNKQSPTFLLGRRTKINNIVDSCPCTVFHETDTDQICNFILDKLGASKKSFSTSDDLKA